MWRGVWDKEDVRLAGTPSVGVSDRSGQGADNRRGRGLRRQGVAGGESAEERATARLRALRGGTTQALASVRRVRSPS
eukprot:7269106-Prymnesium_polylepis.1